MVSEDELRIFLGEDFKTFQSDNDIKNKGVIFCLKLQNVKKRSIAEPVKTSTFGSFLNNVTNTISEKLNGLFNNSYFVCLGDKSFRVFMENKDIVPFNLNINDIDTECDFKDGEVKIKILCRKMDVLFESGELLIQYNNLDMLSAITVNSDSETIIGKKILFNKLGNFKDILNVLCSNHLLNYSFSSINEVFYTIRKYENCSKEDDIFKFNFISENHSLISVDKNELIMLNQEEIINLSNVISTNSTKYSTSILCYEDNKFIFYDIFCSLYKLKGHNNTSLTNLMFIDNEEVEIADKLREVISIQVGIISSKELLMVGSTKLYEQNLVFTVWDNYLYIGNNPHNINKISYFIYNDKMYAMFENGSYTALELNKSIIQNIQDLTINNEEFFQKYNENLMLYHINDDRIYKFMFNQEGFVIGDTKSLYSEINDIKVESEEFYCKVNLMINKEWYEIITAKQLAYEIWKRTEKIISELKLRTFTIQELYKNINSIKVNKLLLGTFGEIAKANRVINRNNELQELMNKIVENKDLVLRSAASSLKSKFIGMDDLQEELLVKVSEIELQKKIILKLLDEWTMIYPHYLGQLEVKSLKYIFGNNVDKAFLERERWRIISNAKRILQQAQMPIFKYLNEITACTARLQAVIPDEIKKVDTSKFRRLKVSDFAGKVSAGADIALGVGVGLEVANTVVRTAYYVNPLSIGMSAKMLVDSYVKDDSQRRDIKIYGFQTLVWWETMIRSLDIVIIEAKQGIENLLENSFQRDGALLKKVDSNARENLQKRLAMLLASEYRRNIDEKFLQVIPERGIFVANILDDIDNMYKNYENKLEEFGDALIL